MIITEELLEGKGACNDSIEWFVENFPDGVELDALIKSDAIKECPLDFIWFLETIHQETKLHALCGVYWSHSVSYSYGVCGSRGVYKSYNVNWSDGVNRSNGVNRSDGVNWSSGVNWSRGVNCSFGCLDCYGIERCLFCLETSGRYFVFNQLVGEERFTRYQEELYSLLGDWRPTFNNIRSLYYANGSNWKLVPVEDVKALSIEEAWAGMPEAAIAYIRQLPEFRANIFENITGITL